MDAIVYAHYFVGSSDWLITEYSPEEDNAFGWACLGGDRQNAELGYVSMAELEAARAPVRLILGGSTHTYKMPVEYEVEWLQVTLTEAIAELDRRQGRTHD